MALILSARHELPLNCAAMIFCDFNVIVFRFKKRPLTQACPKNSRQFEIAEMYLFCSNTDRHLSGLPLFVDSDIYSLSVEYRSEVRFLSIL